MNVGSDRSVPRPSGGAGPTGGLARLVRACAGHPWRTFAAWLAVVASVTVLSSAFGGQLANSTTIPGSDSEQAKQLLTERFPERSGDAARVVFSSDATLTTAEAKQDVEAARAAAAKVPGVISVGDPYASKAGGLSEDQTIGFFEVQFDKPAAEVESNQIHQLEDGVRDAVGSSPVEVEFGGPVVESEQADSKTSETLGFAAAVIVLLLVLGSAVAMAIPITLALVSVSLGLSLLTLAAALTEFNKVTPILAVMIGLGVAIDYALFIVTRFRQALADGHEPTEAAVIAGSTAGRAVIFAGLTVTISISGLALVGIPFVTKLGLGTAMTVVVAVCTAVTLLPAILAKLGHGVNRLGLPLAGRRRSGENDGAGAIARFGRFVTGHPKAFVLVTLATLLVIALPGRSMTLGTADAGTNPSHTTTRRAYDLLAEGFGPGFNGPLLVAVDQQGNEDAADQLAAAIRQTPGVAWVSEPITNQAGDTAQIAVYPSASPQSPETADLVHTIRDEVIPETLGDSGAQAYVGGVTASNEDIASKISDRMPLFLLFVVGITLLILTMAFRSIVVAAKAALTTMLSALAAFGALVAVFEWGWMSNMIGLDTTGPTASYLPLMILSILFGLSMDYEVFLASRIREEYVRGGDARRAVVDGVGAVGKVIVAAALIMGVVFWAFVLNDDRTVKSFGLGLGVAILTDAMIVRMMLVPALMHLLGERAWYIPRWLDRTLPRVTIEAPEEADQVDQPGLGGDPLPAAA
jgi:RND superfamily putative drug exporter